MFIVAAMVAATPATEEILREPGAPRLELLGEIDVGSWVKSVELTPNGRYAVAASIKGRSVAVIDTDSLDLTHVLKPSNFAPVETAFLPGDRALISGGFLGHSVLVYDSESWELLHRISGGRVGNKHQQTLFPKVVATAPDASKFYVAYWRSQNVGVFDAMTFERLGLIRVGDRPRGIAITPDGKKGYVCNYGTKANSIAVFAANRRPFTVLRHIRRLRNPRHIVIDTVGRFAYVSLYGSGRVAKIDLQHDRVVRRSRRFSKHPKTIKLSPDGQWLFVANYGSDSISIVRSDTLAEIARYGAGDFPQGIAVSTDGTHLWSTDSDHVRVWRILPADRITAAVIP